MTRNGQSYYANGSGPRHAPAQSELSKDTCSLPQATRLPRPKLGPEGRSEKTDLKRVTGQGSLSLAAW